MKNRVDRNFKRSLTAARLRYSVDRTSSETVDVIERPRQKQVTRTKRNGS